MMRYFLPAAAALSLILGGCSSDEQKSTAESSTPAKTTEGEKFPNPSQRHSSTLPAIPRS
jgi:hypothetical protein